MRYLLRTSQRLLRSLQQFGDKHAGLRRATWGVLFFALITGILMEQVAPPGVSIQPDDPSPITVVAPHPMENTVLTEQRRLAAAAAVGPVYRVDPLVHVDALGNINAAFAAVDRVRALGSTATATDKVAALRQQLSQPLSDPELQSMLTASALDLQDMHHETVRVLDLLLASKIPPAEVETTRGKLDSGSPALNISDKALALAARTLIKGEIKANVVEDKQATALARKQAADAVEPVMVKQDEVIVKEHSPVTPDQYELLRSLGYIGVKANSRVLTGAGLFSLAMLAIVALYTIRFRPDLVQSDRKLLLLGIITLLTFVLSLLSQAFTMRLGQAAGYLLPVAVGTMLVTITLDAKVALLMGVSTSLLVGAATGLFWPYVVVAMSGALAGAYSVTRLETRTALIKAGFWVGLANALVILSIYLLQGGMLTQPTLWRDMGLGVLNGVVCAVLTIGLLPFLENLFGVLTPLKLLELANPNHPLLKKLLVEAPGSYHHTILVANLCEAAAEAIGADAVLSRVGAYFHDVGKSKRPYFFVENQFGNENPHDRLPANLSALIIASHVKDGYEMARDARLPREVQDFIVQHHGTMLISYFYNKANQESPEQVPESDFRYDGPKPQTKETAICMLADGCEASVRAMRMKGTLQIEEIEAQVRRIIRSRIDDGQLDECPLTLQDLEVIAQTFVKVLSGVHHARIEYPNMPTAQPAQAEALTEPEKTEEEPRVDQHRERTGDGIARGDGADDGAGGGERSPASGG